MWSSDNDIQAGPRDPLGQIAGQFNGNKLIFTAMQNECGTLNPLE